VIVFVCIPLETVTDPPPPVVGSPIELKVIVKLLLVVTPEGSRPEGSRLLVGLKVYTEEPGVKVTLFETRFAIANSCAYRISEAIIYAAPSTEALEEVNVRFNLGITMADSIPMITKTVSNSIKVIPLEFGVLSLNLFIKFI
jgi:hypothetical protein